MGEGNEMDSIGDNLNVGNDRGDHDVCQRDEADMHEQ